MSFLAPLFLFGAAAAAVPLVLHLFRRQPEARLRFAAVKLLKEAPVEHTQRRRLRELLLLALRVSVILLLAFAFGRPFLASGTLAEAAGLTVVALDTSSSLAVPRVFERAKQAARDAIASAPSTHQVAVVRFAHGADVVAPPSTDHGQATAAIDAAMPGLGSTSYRAALAATADLIGSSRTSEAHVVVVTDLQESGWDQGDRVALQDFATIDVVDVSEPVSNLAVSGIRITPDNLIATVRNWGAESREAVVKVQVDGRDGDARPVSLGPNQSGEVLWPRPEGMSARVTVDDSVGLEADNSRYAAIDRAGAALVAVVTATGDMDREAFYLEQALQAAGSASPFEVRGTAASELSSIAPLSFDEFSAVVLLSTRGLDARGRELIAGYLREGGGVLLAAGPDVDGSIVAETLHPSISIVPVNGGRPGVDMRSLAPTDVRHPMFRPFGAGAPALGLVRFSRIATVRSEGCHVLARFTTGEAALVECSPGQGRALVFASDLDNRWNDFPLHVSFVPFVQEAVRYLTGTRRRLREYLVGETPAGVPDEPGVWQLPGAGREEWVAVNVDPDESNPSRLSVAEFEEAVTWLQDVGRVEARLEDRQAEERQHFWQYVLMLMIVLMVVEGFVAARTA